MIPYGRQEVTAEDIEAVVSVLKSDWLTQGPMVPRFEETVGSYCGARYGVAVNSATSALHLACLALELGPGDRFWTSANTFVATANCGIYCGASVDFVDIDSRTGNLDPAALAAKLAQAERDGALPKVVIPVHFAGRSCDMRAIRALADRYDFRILEDASHAIGGRYLDSAIGDCRYSDITVFSFHPVKIVTTGEGGIALTNDRALAERMRLLRSHGIARAIAGESAVDSGAWYYEQRELGYNYRMTDIQAALGVSQMRRVDEYVARRRELAARYLALLDGMPVEPLAPDPEAGSAWHLFVIRLRPEAPGGGRRVVFDRMRARGVGVQVHYIPVHTQPYYRRRGFTDGYLPETESYYSRAMSLPLFPAMTREQQNHVVAVLREALA